MLTLGKGAAANADGSGARVNREALLEAVSSGGELKPHELLQLKVRYFTQGLMLGSQEWIESGSCQALLSKLKRPRGVKPVEELAGGELASVRRHSAKALVEKPR